MSWKSLSTTNYKQSLILKGNDRALLLAEAKRLASFSNCLDPEPASHPCGVCVRCRQIDAGTFPCWFFITPEGKSDTIPIGRIRELQAMLVNKAPEGQCRIAVFQDAHRMHEASQNCLLKTLEEPPAHTLLLLLTGQPQDLLPTVLSRCRVTEVRDEGFVPAQADLELVQDVLSAIQQEGYTAVFKKAAFIHGSRKDRLPDLISALAFSLRESLVEALRLSNGRRQEPGAGCAGYQEALEQVWRAGYLLERNVQPLLVLEDLLLSIKRLSIKQDESHHI